MLKNGPGSGIDIVVCDVAANHGLTGCTTTGTAAQAVMQDVVASFRAPDRADDGTPIGRGPVMIQIEWGPLHDAAKGLDAMR